MSKELEKRTWMYAGTPASYGVADCKCGSKACGYSEYKDRLWCYNCEIDFEPEHWGVFEGPILWEMSRGLGLNFDKIDLVKNVYVAVELVDDEFIEKELTEPEDTAKRLEYLHKVCEDFMKKAGLEFADPIETKNENPERISAAS